MTEINIVMTSIEVKVDTKALRCNYTREMARDISMCVPMLDSRRDIRKESINKIFKTKKHDN